MTVTLDRDWACSDCTFLDTVKRRSTALSGSYGLIAAYGAQKSEMV